MGDLNRLWDIERYYDTVPRPFSTVEEIGPFTLFVATETNGQPYYARPCLSGNEQPTVDDVQRVRARQRALGVPEAFEWIDEVSPGLDAVATDAGLEVAHYPLMVLDRRPTASVNTAHLVALIQPADIRLAEANAAIGAGFGDSDALQIPESNGSLPGRLASGALRLVGAFDSAGAVGGGFHSPRDYTTELAGIAVIPRARRMGFGTAITKTLIEDAYRQNVELIFLSAGSAGPQAMYASLGFTRIATACVAEPS